MEWHDGMWPARDRGLLGGLLGRRCDLLAKVVGVFRPRRVSGVVMGSQQPDSWPERDDTRQLEMCLPGHDIGFLDVQCDGDVAATGVQGSQPPGADLCCERTDRE